MLAGLATRAPRLLKVAGERGAHYCVPRLIGEVNDLVRQSDLFGAIKRVASVTGLNRLRVIGRGQEEDLQLAVQSTEIVISRPRIVVTLQLSDQFRLVVAPRNTCYRPRS